MGQSSAKYSRPRIKYLQKLNQKVPNMDMEEILEWNSEYIRMCKGHSDLSLEEFKKVYNSLFRGCVSEYAEHVFRALDTNGNGKVDFEEFLIGISMTKDDNGNDRDAKIRKMHWAFSIYDVDKSGSISRSEMLQIVKAVFHLISVSGDVDSPDEYANRLFDEINVNGDDEIKLEEFVAAAAKNEKIVSILFHEHYAT